MTFLLLGPLVVRCDGATLPVPPGKQRAVLAALLLSANQAVPVETLAEVVWGSEPPPSAHVTLRNYVRRLRRELRDADHQRISTQPHGYLIRVETDDLDTTRFAALADSARAALRDGSWDHAAAQARAALKLWRGEPLADVQSEVLRLREVPRLTELQMQALEARIEADLHLGGHADVIADLKRLLSFHPFREHLHALHMLALYRCGRQAEALAAYQQARLTLMDELGIEPGDELRELHQRVLAGDPALTVLAKPLHPADTDNAVAGRDRPGAVDDGRAVPRQLPAAVGNFTGRAAELTALSGLLETQPGERPTALVISAIGGTAGVGKTALALQWAHQVAGRFPDGQLYVNLRGYDQDQPVPPGAALAGFLQALGVPGQEIPDHTEDRARLYRSKLAGRRVLVVLDNARDGGQARPLLPGDPGCVTVVTSRDALAGLVATDGARRLDLDVLPSADAVGLLRSLIGPRADEDPAAVAELAELCARLPLALRIAAELPVARAQIPLRDLVTELTTARLDSLDAGEVRADVRTVFSWSCRQLPEDAARAFALAGLHPGSDLDVPAAAALTGTTAGQVRRVLGQLHRASLIQETGPGRYGMHDLLRAYAREQAAARDADGCCHQALTRLFNYYLCAAAAAMDTLYPAEAHHRPRITFASEAVPAMPAETDARAWLDAERANLSAVAAHCAGYGWPQHATELAETLGRYLMTGSHLPEAQAIYSHALRAAQESGDQVAEAQALNRLGSIGGLKGYYVEAVGYFRSALERYRQCGDRTGEAKALHNLGISEFQLHNYRSSADYYRQTIALCEDLDDRRSTARALSNLAAIEIKLGSYEQAAAHLQRALSVFRDSGDQVGEVSALAAMGSLNFYRGELPQATDFYRQSLDLCRRMDYPVGIADVLVSLGKVSVRQREYQQAIGHLRQALVVFRQASDRHGETRALRSLAEALQGAGQPAAAREQLEAALSLATETGNTYQAASAHQALAESHRLAGQQEQADHHRQQAAILSAEDS